MPIAEVRDGNPRRHFIEYDHPDGLYTLEAHTVSKGTEGEVNLAGNQARQVVEGEVLVKTSNPNIYEIYSPQAWSELDLIAQGEQEELAQWSEDEEPVDLFEPSEHSAAEVRRYLRSPEITAEEYDRIVEEERIGLNRASAFPKERV